MAWRTLPVPIPSSLPRGTPPLFHLTYNPSPPRASPTHSFPFPLHHSPSRSTSPLPSLPDKPFAFQITMAKSAASKKVVRSWCVRRLRVAITDVLKGSFGVDQCGRPLGRLTMEGESSGKGVGTVKGTPRGTAAFVVTGNMVTARWEDVRVLAEVGIGKVVREGERVEEQGERGKKRVVRRVG